MLSSLNVLDGGLAALDSFRTAFEQLGNHITIALGLIDLFDLLADNFLVSALVSLFLCLLVDVEGEAASVE